MNARALRLTVLTLVAIGCAALTLFANDAAPDSNAQSIVDPVRSAVPRAARTAASSVQLGAQSIPERRVSSAEFSAALFATHSWRKAPPPPVVIAPQPPAPPPFPYEALGRLNKAGTDEIFFLSRGDRLYDVKIGDVIDGAYSVDAFTDGQLVLTYLPLKMQQAVRVEESRP